MHGTFGGAEKAAANDLPPSTLYHLPNAASRERMPVGWRWTATWFGVAGGCTLGFVIAQGQASPPQSQERGAWIADKWRRHRGRVLKRGNVSSVDGAVALSMFPRAIIKFYS